MFTEILCPACTRKLRLPDEVIGREVSCPSCGHTFVAIVPESAPISTAPQRVPPAPSLEPHRPDSDPEPDSNDRRRRPIHRRDFRRDFNPCPACEKSVRRGAVVCPHCGVDLEEQGDGRTRLPPMRRDAEPSRGGMIRLLGIGSLVCAFVYLVPIGLGLGVAAWTMGRRDLKKMREGEMDRSGRSATHNGWVCGIAGTILNAIMTLGAALILALIIHDANRARAPVNPAFAPAPFVPAQPQLAPNDLILEVPVGGVGVSRGETVKFEVSVIRGANVQRGIVSLKVNRAPKGLQVALEPVAVGPLDGDDVLLSVTATRDILPGNYWIEITATPDRGQAKTRTFPITVEAP